MSLARKLMFATTLVSVSAALPQTQRHADPRQELWSNIKRVLLSDEGYNYFQENIHDALLPALNGTVVSATPSENPHTIVLALSDKTNPEVTLEIFEYSPYKPHDYRRASIPGVVRGDEIEFMGVGDDFVTEPFMVTFKVDLKDLKYTPQETKK